MRQLEEVWHKTSNLKTQTPGRGSGVGYQRLPLKVACSSFASRPQIRWRVCFSLWFILSPMFTTLVCAVVKIVRMRLGKY